MQALNQTALKTYIKPSDVLNQYTITPDEFVLMLLDNSMMKIDNAITAFSEQRFAEFGFFTGRCTAIIDHLRDRLADIESSSIASTLNEHYQTVDQHLQQAIIQNNKADLIYAKLILKQLRNFWAELLSYSPSEPSNVPLQ